MGWSQTDMAKASGLAKKTINRWLNTDDVPKSSSLYKVAKASGFSVEWLRGESDVMLIQTIDEVQSPEEEYDPHGGWEPHKMDSEDYALLGQTFEILQSESAYRTALVHSIKAFHRAIKSESVKNEEIESLKSDIEELRKRIDLLEKDKAFDKGECQP